MANPQNKQNSQTEGQKNTINDPQRANKTSQSGNTGFEGSGSTGGTSSTSPTSTTGTTGRSGQTGDTSFGGTGNTTSSTGMTGTPSSTGTGSTGGAATATARSFIDQAKETAGQAYEAVTDKAATKLEERKSTLTTPLATVADSVRQMSANLGSAKTDSGLAESAAKYTDTAARKIENLAGYFETRSVRDMARDLEGYARRNPAIFLGAAFGLGVLAARFLKSSPQNFNEGSGEFNRTGSVGTDHQLTTGTTGTKRGGTGDAPSKAVNPL